MKKILAILVFALLAAFCFAGVSAAKTGDAVRITEPFKATVLTEGLDVPWEIVWGPDGMLWVTERLGKRVTRVNPATGEKKVAVTIDEAHAAGGHEGVLGLALARDFLKEGGSNHAYVVYTYMRKVNNTDLERKKIVRYDFDPKEEQLANPHTIIDDIPAGNDHNAGRVVIGPDDKLYLSLGELGHNQGSNLRKPIEAQRLPTAEELYIKDWSSYLGKVLRINLDGSIPADNPTINGVKSHVFTYGHRNPQGLAFVGETLFSCEHGPSVDDELNRLIPGGNYGWPHVAGFRDNQSYRYVNWSKASDEAIKNYDPSKPDTFPAGVAAEKETDWSSPDFVEPVKTFHTVPNGYNFKDSRFEGVEYVFWPTVAPSSIAYYPENGPIRSWRNAILMTTLKTGRLYVLKLNHDKVTVQGDAIAYFHTPNRYRAVALNPDASKVFVITDSSGNGLDYDGNATKAMQNPGSIILFEQTPNK